MFIVYHQIYYSINVAGLESILYASFYMIIKHYQFEQRKNMYLHYMRVRNNLNLWV